MTSLQHDLDLAIRHHQAGRLPEAENLYRQILTRQPDHADSLHLLGVIAAQTGRNDAAVDLIGRAVALLPGFADARRNLSNVLKSLGRLDEAIRECRAAMAAFDPNCPDAHFNLGDMLASTGAPDQAIAAYRQAIALRPDFPDAWLNLGNALKVTGQLDAAIDAYHRAIASRPSYFEAHMNLGSALKDKGQLDEAIVEYRQAIALRPGVAPACVSLGNALKENGKPDEAVAAFRQAIVVRPDYFEAHVNLGNALKDIGQLDEATAAYRQAVALRPDAPEGHSNLGNALKDKGESDAAIAACRRAIAIDPGYADAYGNLGTILADQGQLDAAVAAYRQSVALKANSPEACNNLGVAEDMGQQDEAIAAFRQAVDLKPDFAGAHGNLIYTMHYHGGYEGQAIAAELRRWERQHAGGLRKLIKPHSNDRRPDRRLRIGYVSPDFRDHVVARNILPLIHRHDRSQFEIVCYAQVARPDAVTDRFRQIADGWRSIVGLSDERAAEQIRRDQIDILVDLALHTAQNRLLIFARKPAPVQVTFAGYPGSTGLTTIEYRLSDPYLHPDGMDESIYSERTVRLPDSFWCYDPMDCRDVPEQVKGDQESMRRSGVITFGCLNNFCKFNDTTLRLWAAVLRQVDRSRLLLLAHPGSHRQRTLDRLSAEGIDPARVEFIPRESRRGYLEQYRRIDIGLDTFPYNGHTTSLDSFWMGVPVVTLVGQTAVSRAGWCQLSNLGLTELAGQTPEQFVRIAVELAGDLPRLKELRATLRQRMERSPLMDFSRFARNIEAAYRRMWRTWCAA